MIHSQIRSGSRQLSEMQDFIYLDNNSTTKVDPRVVEAMLPFFGHLYSNASSLHSFGAQAARAISSAAEEISSFIEVDPSDLIFTSGATESINLAIKGYCLNNIDKGNHLIIQPTEHKAVLDSCAYLEKLGFEISYLPIDHTGIVIIAELSKLIRKETIMVSVMSVNNETGVIQPIEQISQICIDQDIMFFTDATQAVGKQSTNFNRIKVGAACFTAHKFNGPKGIGCLFVRNLKRQAHNFAPIIHGGGHQHALRSGTLNVPAIMGLAKACQIAGHELIDDSRRIRILRDQLESELLSLPGTKLNGDKHMRVSNVTNICFIGSQASDIIRTIPQIAISNGSACTSNAIEPSHVLKEMGLSDDDAYASLRFSLGKFTTPEDIEYTIETFKSLFYRAC